MSTRALSGMEYLAFEITLRIGHAPKELTKALRTVLEDHPHHWLHTVTVSLVPYDGNSLVYTVMLANA